MTNTFRDINAPIMRSAKCDCKWDENNTSFAHRVAATSKQWVLTIVLVAINVCGAWEEGSKGGQPFNCTGHQVELTPHQGLCWSGDDALARTSVDVDCPRQALSKWSTDSHIYRHGKTMVMSSAFRSNTHHFNKSTHHQTRQHSGPPVEQWHVQTCCRQPRPLEQSELFFWYHSRSQCCSVWCMAVMHKGH